MEKSHLPLRVWFWAAYLLATLAAEQYDWELIGERFRRMIEEV